MTAPVGAWLRPALIVALFAAWAVAAHLASAGGGHPAINVLLGIGPIALVAGILIFRLPNTLLRGAGLLAGLLLLARIWPYLHDNVQLLYYLQHLGTHLALGTLFGRTLFGPGEALITRCARAVFKDGMSERKIRYTRQVTIVWTAFFFTNAAVSTLLFLFAPPAIWSIYANLLGGPLIALLFLIEHLWRRRVLPPEERPSLAMAIRAYREGMQQDVPAGRS